MTIADFDHLDKEEKKKLLFPCCGSSAWVNKMLTIPPVEDLVDLEEEAEEKWYECSEADWKEAFSHHPKIGDMSSLREKFAKDQWAEGEQSSVKQASEEVLRSLTEGNKLYEEKFGYIFIVCATGRSAEEMLGMMTARLHNSPADEIQIAMEEQLKITKLRLEKLFND
jgi:2-oxo-4-hydroxy-4-carboxy-5-ureidoimidazoline decarboxylase